MRGFLKGPFTSGLISCFLWNESPRAPFPRNGRKGRRCRSLDGDEYCARQERLQQEPISHVAHENGHPPEDAVVVDDRPFERQLREKISRIASHDEDGGDECAGTGEAPKAHKHTDYDGCQDSCHDSTAPAPQGIATNVNRGGCGRLSSERIFAIYLFVDQVRWMARILLPEDAIDNRAADLAFLSKHLIVEWIRQRHPIDGVPNQ